MSGFNDIVKLIWALLLVVIGLNFAAEVISAAVTAGTTTGIGSFIGTALLNNIVPTLYYLLLFSVAFFVGGGGRLIASIRGQ